MIGAWAIVAFNGGKFEGSGYGNNVKCEGGCEEDPLYDVIDNPDISDVLVVAAQSEDVEEVDGGDVFEPDTVEDWSYDWEDDFDVLDDDDLYGDVGTDPWDSFAYNEDPQVVLDYFNDPDIAAESCEDTNMGSHDNRNEDCEWYNLFPEDCDPKYSD